MDEEKPWIIQLYTNPNFWVYLFAFFFLIILIYLRIDNPYKKSFFQQIIPALFLQIWFIPGFTIVAIWLKKIKNSLNYSNIKIIGTIILLLLLTQLIGCVTYAASWINS